MAWLRLDDGFDTNHKILELREVERWRWTRVLVYCAKNRNKGVVTATVLRELGLEKTVQKLLQIGLLDELSGNAYRVHDWYVYNGESLEERVGAYMADHPEATANEVYRVIGGKRSLVLKVFADRSLVGSTEPPTRGSREPHASGTLASGEAKEQVPGNHIDDAKSGSSEPGSGGSLSGPRARAHRRAPLPTPKNEEPLAALRTESYSLKADAGLTRATFEQPAPASHTTPKPTDPLGKLVLELRDRDAGTEHVFRLAFDGLPEAAFEYTRDEILRCRADIDSDCGTARRILERIAETGNIGDPDYAAPSAEAKPESTLTAFERAKALITNLAKAEGFEPRDVDTELDAHGITDQAERLALHLHVRQLHQAEAA